VNEFHVLVFDPSLCTHSSAAQTTRDVQLSRNARRLAVGEPLVAPMKDIFD
jgi:hypothetical protein